MDLVRRPISNAWHHRPVLPAITVFTPTYQRRETLDRVYRSLDNQTFEPDRFEWIIVDDGSTDGTREMVRKWAKRADFSIRYIWQENGGKHRAINQGVKESAGELFACLDSDDACTPTALEQIWGRWTEAQVTESRKLAGVIARCQDPRGLPIGPPFPLSSSIAYAELTYCQRHRWESWHVPRVETLRRHPFPNGPRGRYVPESTVWNAVAEPWALLDSPVRIYHTGIGHDRSDRISNVQSVEQNAEGLLLRHQSLLSHSWRVFACARMDFLTAACMMTRFALASGRSPRQAIHGVTDRRGRVLCWVTWPVGAALHARDRLSRRP